MVYGTADTTTVSGGGSQGFQDVYGTATDTTLINSGLETIYSGGQAIGTMVPPTVVFLAVPVS